MSGLAALRAALSPWVLVGGKGGVGKTTCAAALALDAAAAGERTLLLGTDPAAALGDVLGAPLHGVPAPVPDAPGLDAMQVDPAAEHAAFLARWRAALLRLVEGGTYVGTAEAAALVDGMLPGADEGMALLALLRLARGAAWDRVVVDTAPTGHTLRLLRLPEALEALVASLEAMQARERAVARALAGRPPRRDDTDALLDHLRGDGAALRRTLGDPARCAMVLVARAEPLVAAETARYARHLTDAGVAVGAVVVNAVPASLSGAGRMALASLAAVARGAPHLRVPVVAPPRGAMALRAWSAAVRRMPPARRPSEPHGDGMTRGHARAAPRHPLAAAGQGPAHAEHAAASLLRAVRALTIVGGKGGTGKSTAACALALLLARRGACVRLISTDPAPSLADALDAPVTAELAPVPGVPSLLAQQLDARAEWQRFRSRVAGEITLATGGARGGAALTADERVLQSLLEVMPPGVDELYALAALGGQFDEEGAAGAITTDDGMADGGMADDGMADDGMAAHAGVGRRRAGVVIVDPAPTGHLLRLLELPETAVAWSQHAMRVLLAMQPVVPLGETAAALLRFTRRTRALATALRDPLRAALILVALDEPLVRAESERLAARAAELGVPVRAVLWNRAAHTPAPLPRVARTLQFAAPATAPPPRGASALRQWAASWHPLPTDPDA